jgi:hypothetical protein
LKTHQNAVYATEATRASRDCCGEVNAAWACARKPPGLPLPRTQPYLEFYLNHAKIDDESQGTAFKPHQMLFGGHNQRVAGIGRKTLRQRKAKFLAHDVGAEHQ